LTPLSDANSPRAATGGAQGAFTPRIGSRNPDPSRKSPPYPNAERTASGGAWRRRSVAGEPYPNAGRTASGGAWRRRSVAGEFRQSLLDTTSGGAFYRPPDEKGVVRAAARIGQSVLRAYAPSA
jgi:hypothetical protein